MKKGSETKIIKRSQINLNPCNPKLHTEADIKLQKANIKKVGLLGGIQWNENTGNLIDGHKRVMSCDLIQGYDGTPETDYDIKVEAVDFDDNTEKEQLLFMAKSQDPIDFNVVATKFDLDDINLKNAGFTDDETQQLMQLRDDLDKSLDEGMETFDDDFLSPQMDEQVPPPPITELPNVEKTSEEIVAEHAAKPKMTKEEVKEQKQHCTNVAMNRQEDIDNFVFINFETLEQKQLFCDMLGMVASSSMTISGSQILGML
uniref:ParB protein n=1 Tax=Siphoviridae sp. ctmHK36 TaxID=2827931 RepID=A0A8S5TB85_9CAUD|nr:MAG TPA: ParB protein [Siphoviridae sp. ctmHK36]